MSVERLAVEPAGEGGDVAVVAGEGVHWLAEAIGNGQRQRVGAGLAEAVDAVSAGWRGPRESCGRHGGRPSRPGRASAACAGRGGGRYSRIASGVPLSSISQSASLKTEVLRKCGLRTS